MNASTLTLIAALLLAKHVAFSALTCLAGVAGYVLARRPRLHVRLGNVHLLSAGLVAASGAGLAALAALGPTPSPFAEPGRLYPLGVLGAAAGLLALWGRRDVGRARRWHRTAMVAATLAAAACLRLALLVDVRPG